MFLDNLSTSVLKLYDTRRLSYEAASERCDLSSRYFADIARGKTAPTILTLEKLCVGFELTPNDLLIPSELWREMAFREPMPVTHIRCFRYLSGVTGFPVCPQCGKTMEREYQSYCDRCGQCLDWKDFPRVVMVDAIASQTSRLVMYHPPICGQSPEPVAQDPPVQNCPAVPEPEHKSGGREQRQHECAAGICTLFFR